MHPESLAKYKLQVYNPGSPFPSPTVEPLQSFVRNPDNPLKITFSAKRKCEFDSPPKSPPKRSKMATKEEIRDMLKESREETIQILKTDNKADIEELKKQSKADMLELQAVFAKTLAEEQAKAKVELNEKFGTVQNQLESLVKSQKLSVKTVTENKAESDARIKALEDKLENFQSSVQATPSTSTSLENPPSDSTWKANLVREVFEHEHGLIIHGLRLECSSDTTKQSSIRNFFKSKLNAPDDMLSKLRIKDVCRLGSDNGAGKPPPLLVKFGHPTERNQLLPLSKNLDKKEGISIDKNIPKLYQKTHRDFKRSAWKLSLLYNVQTQVVFDSYKLVLRYKKKDEGVNKYNYTTEKEWFPQPCDLEASLASNSGKDPNKLDTPTLDTSKHSDCNKVVIATGVCDSINQNNAKNEFMSKLIAQKDHELLTEINFKSKGVVILTCVNWAGCKTIVDNYNTKEMLGKKVFLHIYSETEPSD